MKILFRFVATIMLLLVVLSGFAQKRNGPTNRDKHARAEWFNTDYMVWCPCGHSIDKPQSTNYYNSNRNLYIKQYRCRNCKTLWDLIVNLKMELVDGPKVHSVELKKTGGKHIEDSSCYAMKEDTIDWPQIIDGKEYPGICLSFKNQCKFEESLYVIIHNIIKGEKTAYELPHNYSGYVIINGKYKYGVTHSEVKAKEAMGFKDTTAGMIFQPPVMEYGEFK